MRRGNVLAIAVMAFAIVAFLVLVNFSLTSLHPTSSANKNTSNISSYVPVIGNENVNEAVVVNGNVNAAVETDATKGWKTYNNAKYEFSFKYPQNLRVTRENDYSKGILVVVSDKKDLPDGGSVTTEEYDIRLNPDGYGPQFPYNTWTIEKTAGNGFRVASEKNDTATSPNTSRVELVATEASAISGTGFRMNFFNDPVINKTIWEKTLREVLSSFDFTAGWKMYENKNFSYLFKYPSDWTPKTINDPYYSGKAILSTLHNPGFQEPYGAVGGIFINVYANNNVAETLDEWFAKNREVTEQKKKDRVKSPCAGTAQVSDMMTEVSSETVGGLLAIVQYEKDLKPTYCEGGATTTKAYFVKRGTIIFEIIASSPTSTEADGLIQVFDQIMDTFTFTN